ncbi:MAG: transmembrane 220 family protein [Akkermansiaceae bacterium]
MKILFAFLALLFGAFAAFQWNDIDPEVYTNPSRADAIYWLFFYALIAVGFLTLCFRKIPFAYFVIAGICCLIAMGMSISGVIENLTGAQPFTLGQESMSAEDPRVELSREFFGALIALAAVFFQFKRNRLPEQTSQS